MSTTTAPGATGPAPTWPLQPGLLAAGPQGVRAGPQGVRAGPPAAVDNATLVEREDVSPTVARFVVRPDCPMPPFAAGQYVALGLRVEGRLVQRPYSTAACPRTAGAHELLVRLVPDGTFTPALWRLQIGARLRVGPPKGTFVLEPDDDRTHLLAASGTGLAPFVAMARDLLGRTAPPPIVLVHGVSRAEDLAYRALLVDHDAAGSLAYVPTVSRPRDPGSAGWDGRTGRTEIAVAEVAATLDPTTTVAYLCGNAGMVEAVSRLLGDRGFDDVRIESFWDGRVEGDGVAA